MQKTIKSIRAILLAIVLAVGVFVTTAAPVYAAVPTLTKEVNPGDLYPGVTFITENSATINFTSDIEINFYSATYVAPGPGFSIGNEQDIIDGLTAVATTSGSEVGTMGSTISGLSPGTSYITYLVAEDYANPGDFSNILTFTFTTLGTAGGTYTVTSGANQSWKQGSGVDLVFISDGDFAKFTGIKVDGAAVAAANYTAVSGSTVVTLKAAYLATLPLGARTLEFVFTDGSVSTGFTILTSTGGGGGGAAATTGVSPKTDDATGGNMFLLVMMLLLAAGAVYTGRKAVKAKR